MKSKNLKIDEEALQNMIRDAEKVYPDECCGFLFGTENEESREILNVLSVNNVREAKRRRYEISPQDYQRAEIHAVNTDQDLLGIYHSHPDHPAIASEYDRAHALPHFSYIILSVNNGKVVDVKSWQLNDDEEFEQEEILNKTLSN